MSSNRGRKPAASVELSSNESQQKPAENAAGGSPISQRLPPPSHLGKYAKQEWRRVLPKLAGVATNLDYAALVTYCSAYDTMIEADITLQRDGIIIKTLNGIVAHPATRIKASAADQVRRYQTEFGLTPLARLRVQPAPPEEDDDLAKMC